jgi:molybdopterin-synthase adenylyltransferase
MQRPRLKRTTQRMEAPNGDIYLLRPSSGTDIHIEDPDPAGRRLLASLDGTKTRDELIEEFGSDEVADLLAQFEELGVVDDAADDDAIPDDIVKRFDRQLRYFSDVTTEPTAAQCQARLEKARIAVLGVGGLGGSAAMYLGCSGIGELLLVDFDRVELSNLNRQVLYSESDIGRFKTEAAAERLGALNSTMRVETLTQRLDSQTAIREVITGYDLVLDSCDWPAHDIERWINAACFAADIPFIAMSHFAPMARVGPLYIPGVTGCFVCQEIGYRRTFPLYDIAVSQQRGKSSPGATLGAACGLVGGLVGLEILHQITGLARPSTLGVGHTYDLRTMTVDREPVVPDPSCPVCGGMQPSSDQELRETAPR